MDSWYCFATKEKNPLTTEYPFFGTKNNSNFNMEPKNSQTVLKNFLKKSKVSDNFCYIKIF